MKLYGGAIIGSLCKTLVKINTGQADCREHLIELPRGITQLNHKFPKTLENKPVILASTSTCAEKLKEGVQEDISDQDCKNIGEHRVKPQSQSHDQNPKFQETGREAFVEDENDTDRNIDDNIDTKVASRCLILFIVYAVLAVLRVKGSFQEAALIIFPSTPIKNTEDGMKRWLRRAKKRVNRTYESKEHY
ncbi:hypothetical protein NQ317_016527, partial [Molorchus minor]